MPLCLPQTRSPSKILQANSEVSSTHGTYPEDSLQMQHRRDSLKKVALLMNEDRSPSKNALRGMLIRRALSPKVKKPKRLKKSKTKSVLNRKLLEKYGSIFSESEISDTSSSLSLGQW
nr:ORF3 [Torque teno felis virus]QYD01800.1 ORF3 [Torque teno felis virus]QYD01848.1 ORF3 [Torque teno felis virus]QYD01851.1 ORF3 [Torque teno felis virus]